MLKSLEIRDFALIEHLRVDWTPGLNILTGETGAGKSILMDALNTVLGGKAGAGLIRVGAEKAHIEAEFCLNSVAAAWLKHHELIEEESSSFIVSRELNKSGTRARINGTLVNVSVVQELAQILLTVHAQHEARTLMSAQAQLEMLDSLGDSAHKKQLEMMHTLYARLRDVSEQLKALEMSEEERTRRLDFATFQLNELEEAKLVHAGEDVELSEQQLVLSNVSLLQKCVSQSLEFLSGSDRDDSATSALDTVQSALAEIERAAKFDNQLEESGEQIRTGLANIEEAVRTLRRYGNGLETDPEKLAVVDGRIAQLATIKRKYGPTIEDAMSRQNLLIEEVEKLANAQSSIKDMGDELDGIRNELTAVCNSISQTRLELAKKLCKSISLELRDLGMERCRFDITFERLLESGPNGVDRVEFMIAPNPGQPPQPLSKIASGGELSRIMLAIKTIFAATDKISTVIFDEIDTGLSGRVLQSMRDKLAKLAQSHQILCITHQPIIASIADNHIQVCKLQDASSTTVSAQTLGQAERLRSLASMASGQDDEAVALKFAQSLVDQANQIRSTIGH